MNKQKENWIKFIYSGIDLSGNVYIANMSFNFTDLIIILNEWNSDKRFRIIFSNIYLYRTTSESLRENLEQYLSNEYGCDFFQKWSLFLIKNSSYIKNLNLEDKSQKLTHFVVMGSESIIDIISKTSPTVSIIE